MADLAGRKRCVECYNGDKFATVVVEQNRTLVECRENLLIYQAGVWENAGYWVLTAKPEMYRKNVRSTGCRSGLWA